MGRLHISLFRADTGGWHEAQGSDNTTGLVRENVSLHIFEQHHPVKLSGIDHQLKRGIVHQDRLIRYVWIVLGNILHNLPPETGCGQNIGFMNVGEFCFSLSGFFKCHDGHPPYIFCFVDAVIPGIFHFRGGTFNFFAEIDAAHQFTNHQDINPVTDNLIFEGREGFETRRQPYGSEIGEGIIALSKGQDGTQFRSVFLWNPVHFFYGQTHWTFGDDVGFIADAFGFVRKWGPFRKVC